MPFAGEIAEIRVGELGLTGTLNQSQPSPRELLLANNLTFENGTVQKEGGAAKFNSTAVTGTPKILAGWDWDHDGSTQRSVVVTDAGTILKDDGAGSYSTTLKSGLTLANVVPNFVEGGKEALAGDRKLFIFTEKNPVQVLAANGATTVDIGTPPVDWAAAIQPIVGLIHENRLWGALGHLIYFSTLTDHEDFQGAGSGTVAVFPGEGEKIVAALSFKGHIVVFKRPFGIYDIDTTSTTITEWSVDRITQKVGTLNPLTVAIVDDDIVYLDHTANLHSLEATEEFGNFKSSSLSELRDMAPFLRNNVNFSALRQAQIVYYEAKREVHCGMPGLGASDNTRRLVMDLNRPEEVRFRFSDRDTPISLWLKKDVDGVPRLAIGDDAGFVWDLDQEVRSRDGSGYAGQFQTPNDDLSSLDAALGTVNKNGAFLELVVEPKGNWTLDVDVLWDGEITQTVSFNMGTSGAALGSFVLGTDKLSDEQVLNKRKRITGSGRRFSVIASNSGAAEDFSVAVFYLHFKRAGERDLS